MHHPRLEELVRRRQAFPVEAYEFVRDAIAHAASLRGMGADADIGARHMLEAACDLARREFGMLALSVFHAWGVRRTDDLGEIVTHLVEARLLEPASHDDLAVFRDAFALEPALGTGLPIDFPTDDEEP